MSATGRLERETPFAAPWEAQVFAMVETLRANGVFSAAEWASALAAAIRPAGQAEAVADYTRWLEALETLVARRGIADQIQVEARRDAFLRAAAATPHGQPILLANDPLHDSGAGA